MYKITHHKIYQINKYHIHQHGITMYVQWSNNADVRVISSYLSMG